MFLTCNRIFVTHAATQRRVIYNDADEEEMMVGLQQN